MRNRILAVVASFVVTFSASVSALEPVAVERLIGDIKTSVENPPPALDDARARDAVRWVWEQYGDPTVAQPTLEQFQAAMTGLFEKPLLSPEKARAYVQERLLTATGPERDDRAAALITLLHPYVVQAGLCQDDPTEPGTMHCAFRSPASDPSMNVVAEIDDPVFGKKAIPEAPVGSALRYIIDPNDTSFPGLQAAASTTAGPVSTECTSFSYGYYWSYKWVKEAWHISVRLWGQVTGYANARLLATNSDTLFAHIPVGLYCGWDCYMGIIFDSCLDDAVKGDPRLIECLVRETERRDYLIYGSSYIEHAEATACGVAPARYADRPYFQDWQSGAYDYMIPPEAFWLFSVEDFRFQTHYQTPPDETTKELMFNLFPTPSYMELKPATDSPLKTLTTWRHQFSQTRGFHNDLIFGANDAIPYASLCRVQAKHPDASQYVTGNLFQFWHASGAELPGVNLSAGYNANHLVYTCLDSGIPPTIPVPTSVPRISVPRVSVPRVSVPRTSAPSVPRVSTPRVSVPRTSVPSVPRVSTPRVSVPRTTVPSVPRVSVPRSTVPTVSTPRVSVPRASVPTVSVPRVSVPRTSVPRVSTPNVSKPRVSVPRPTISDPCPGGTTC